MNPVFILVLSLSHMVPNAGLTEFCLQSIVHCLHPLVLDWHSFEDTLPRSDNGEVDGGGLGDNLDYFLCTV